MKRNILFFIAVAFSISKNSIAQNCTTPNAPVVSGATIAQCVNNSAFTLTANSNTNSTGWYTFPYGGSALSTNSTFVTPSYTMSSGATYYVNQFISIGASSIGIGTQASIYSGNTRGMWFTAPVDFVITGVQVPTSVSTGSQSIAIMKFASVPPTYASTTNSFNTLYLTQNNPAAGIIPVNIPIYAGDIIGVLGCRYTGSAYGTSYGATAPIVNIGTSTLTLNRLGMQYNLATQTPTDVWTEAASIGRTELYTSMGCLSPYAPVTVTVTPAPQILVSGATTICSGSSTTLTASGVTSYTWSNNSNATSIVVSPNATSIYTISGSISSTCGSSSTVQVVVQGGAPILSINTSTNSTCLGKTVTLTASGANTYTWTNGIVNGSAYTPTSTASYTVTGQNACSTSTAVTTISVSPLAVQIAANPTIVCAGSISTISTISSGNSFTWSPISNNGSNLIVSPIANTNYSVVVSDGTCSGTASITLLTKPIPTIALSPTLTNICAGNSVSLTATGGISYTWSANNATLAGNTGTITVIPTSPTGYNVVGSNSVGCVSSAASAIVTYPSPTISVSANPNLVCFGDAVLISAAGASTYVWDSGATTSSISLNPTISTVYTVTGTSLGCTSTETVAVAVFIPTLSISGTSSVCAGSVASLNSSSATTYSWTNGFTIQGFTIIPNSTTVYSLSALTTSSGINCPSSASFQVLVIPKPTLTASAQRTLMCKGESNTISVTGANTYSWDTGNTASSFTILPNLITTNIYTVMGISNAGCSGTASVSVKVNACTSLNELNKLEQNFSVYPNPNNGEFTVKTSEPSQVNLYNQLGQKINSFNLDAANNFEFKISDLSKGIYFIFSSNKIESKQKIIVE